MNNNQLIIIILVILVLLYSIKYYSKNNNTTKNETTINTINTTTKLNENFENEILTLYNPEKLNDDIETKYYLYIKNNGTINKNLFNLLKINQTTKLPNNNILLNNKVTSYNKFPVNIIYYPQNLKENIEQTYLAVFNDGALYKSNNILNNDWIGPLPNSYPNVPTNTKICIPLRHINLTNNGEIIGVGYDGNIYKKKSLDEIENSDYDMNIKNEPYNHEWELWNNNTAIKFKFILLNKNNNYEEDEASVEYFGINNSNELHIYTYNNSSNLLKQVNKITTPDNNIIYRLYYDIDDKLLFINENRELKRTKENIKTIIEKTEITIDITDDKNSKNPNILYDIIYNTDGTLIGMGSFNNNIKMLKQENKFHYLYPFKLINNLRLSSTDTAISKNTIAELKSGYIIKEEEEDKDKEKIDSLDKAYEVESNKDLISFKTFCDKRSKTQYNNLEILNNINNFENKINELKEVKKELLNLNLLSTRTPQQDTP